MTPKLSGNRLVVCRGRKSPFVISLLPETSEKRSNPIRPVWPGLCPVRANRATGLYSQFGKAFLGTDNDRLPYAPLQTYSPPKAAQGVGPRRSDIHAKPLVAVFPNTETIPETPAIVTFNPFQTRYRPIAFLAMSRTGGIGLGQWRRPSGLSTTRRSACWMRTPECSRACWTCPSAVNGLFLDNYLGTAAGPHKFDRVGGTMTADGHYTYVVGLPLSGKPRLKAEPVPAGWR